MPFEEQQPGTPEAAVEKESLEARQVLLEAGRELLNESLRLPEGIEGVRAWRNLDEQSRGARRTRRFFDLTSALNYAALRNPGQKEKLASAVKNILAAKREEERPSRLDELEDLILAQLLEEPLPKVRPAVKNIFTDLKQAPSREGAVNVFELLSSSRVEHGAKTEWFLSQVLSAVEFLERADYKEAKKRVAEDFREEIIKEKEGAPEMVPPPEQDSFAPSMEELAKAKEGEPGAFFTILPFYGGYYKEGSFDRWNSQSLRWERRPREWREVEEVLLEAKTRRVFSGAARAGEITPLPLPYGFAVNTAGIKSGERIRILQDDEGNYAAEAHGEGLVNFIIEIGRSSKAEGGIKEPFAEQTAIETGELSADTEEILKEIGASERSVLEKARMLKAYVRRALNYSNDSSMNAVYGGGDPAGYFRRIEKEGKADCDVANTYYVALLSRLNIAARLVTGHYVKSKDQKGAAVISSGTGHAWSEVWDGAAWHRLDATPPGDPAMDEEETDELPEEEVGEGDFGEEEAVEISDKELKEMIKEAEEFLEELAKKERSKSKEEIAAAEFARQAECGSEEAKEVLAQIEAARGLRDRRGRLIRGRLIREFQKIVQENLIERRRYKAPVRMSEGHELAEPVAAALDIKTGEADPTGFAKYEKKMKREQVYGGLDVILVVDKSSSMREADPQSGLLKWQEQQKFVFLLMDALYAAAEEFKRRRVKLISPMDVRTALVSFNAGGAAVEAPLGSGWTPKEQYQVWRALQENIGGGTPDHLGLGAAREIIEKDQAAPAAEKNRLRLVLVSADGGSDDAQKTLAAKEHLKELGAVVKAAGIGAGAKAIEATYYPDGKNMDNFGEVPDWAAEHVITEARELYPRKVKK